VDEPSDIGRRLRRVRQARGKSLAAIAGLAGISKDHLSQLEHGERALDRRSLVVALATALEVAPQDLTALPVPAPGNDGTDAAVHAVRVTLLAVGLHRPDGSVAPVHALRGRLDTVREVRGAGRFVEVGAALPGLIRDLYASIGAGRDVAELLTLAVDLHVHVTVGWLRDAGAPLDLRCHAAMAAHHAARDRDEPHVLGTACYGAANALLASSAFDLARAKLDSAPTLPVTGDTVPLVGMLAMTSALVAAADNRHGDVSAPMKLATELAEHTGEPSGTEPFGFGPTNVGLWQMALALESGEPDRAVSIAERVDPRRHPFATRRCAYWIDYGRALARLRGRRDDAVTALRTAESIYPTRVHRSPFAREVLSELMVRARRDAVGRELRGMAYRAGLPV
jgi:Helix-turn-helix domain